MFLGNLDRKFELISVGPFDYGTANSAVFCDLIILFFNLSIGVLSIYLQFYKCEF